VQRFASRLFILTTTPSAQSRRPDRKQIPYPTLRALSSPAKGIRTGSK